VKKSFNPNSTVGIPTPAADLPLSDFAVVTRSAEVRIMAEQFEAELRSFLDEFFGVKEEPSPVPGCIDTSAIGQVYNNLDVTQATMARLLSMLRDLRSRL